MKVKTKSRSHKYHINRPTSRHRLTYTNKHKKCLSMMMLISIKQHPPTLEVQFMKMLRNTEAKLEKMCSL